MNNDKIHSFKTINNSKLTKIKIKIIQQKERNKRHRSSKKKKEKKKKRNLIHRYILKKRKEKKRNPRKPVSPLSDKNLKIFPVCS